MTEAQSINQKKAPKKPYLKPTLKELGDIKVTTRGSGGSMGDGMLGMTRL